MRIKWANLFALIAIGAAGWLIVTQWPRLAEWWRDAAYAPAGRPGQRDLVIIAGLIIAFVAASRLRELWRNES
mgnify:CR=1 FL=1